MVPATFEALAFDAHYDAFLRLEQVESYVAQYVISACICNSLCYLRLAAHRINGHYAPFQVEQLQ